MTISTINTNFNRCYEYGSTPSGYDLDTVIRKIKDSSTEGKKVAVFIGRTHAEKLPQEDGVVWFSLNLKNPKPLKNEEKKMDFHLQINFEDEEKLSRVEKLFDKVVVDRETYKFFTGFNTEPAVIDKKAYKFSEGSRDIPIEFYHEKTTKKLINLLKPGGEEELICDFAPRKNLRAGRIICQNRPCNKKVKEEHTWYKHMENLETEVMLKKLFENVSYVTSKPFPYEITCYSGERTYFILKGLKT